MRQKIRLSIVFIILLLFPVILNFFSPYVSIDGAFAGVISGSLLVFFIMFLTGLFFGRAWCAWVCPMAGLSELSTMVNAKRAPVKKLTVIRYAIFTVWLGVLITGFIVAGGIKGIDPLHLTDNFVSVDEPAKYVIYYAVVFIFFGLNLWLGKRASCHGICWMSPWLVGGYLLGKMVRLPQLRVKSKPSACINCKSCTKTCPMSIEVDSYVASGEVSSLDCILCGRCVDGCPKGALHYGVRKS